MDLSVQARTRQLIITILILSSCFFGAQQCSLRLENALEHMRRRSSQLKSRSLDTPYSIYQSIYVNDKAEDEENGSRSNFYDNDFEDRKYKRKPHSLPASRVEVEDMKVRFPQKAARWVEVDKCRFSTVNRTLDTRLIFPDLTISGKVVLQPTGGTCNMILRLRRAGIEFRTVPMTTGMDESRHNRPVASVRTDSHFAEPGFISVFAHGCQGPTGIKLRQNSKRRFGFDNEESASKDYNGANNQRRWGKYFNAYRPPYDHRKDSEYEESAKFNRRFTRETPKEPFEDVIFFEDDIFNFNDDLNQLEPDARTFADIFSQTISTDRTNKKWHNVGTPNTNSHHTSSDDINNALTKELEQLFSMGVKGLLTKYMQRALQPAIKETLMENMGYTLSYG